MASFRDIGAIQRREAADGSPVANTSYNDLGGIQREEASAEAAPIIHGSPVMGQGLMRFRRTRSY